MTHGRHRSNTGSHSRRCHLGSRIYANRLFTAPDILRSYRAIEVLEGIGNANSKETLRGLAGGDADARQTQEAQAALRRLDRK